MKSKGKGNRSFAVKAKLGLSSWWLAGSLLLSCGHYHDTQRPNGLIDLDKILQISVELGNGQNRINSFKMAADVNISRTMCLGRLIIFKINPTKRMLVKTIKIPMYVLFIYIVCIVV